MMFFRPQINILRFIWPKLCSTVYNGVLLDIKQKWGHVFGRSALIFHRIAFKNVLVTQTIMPVILIPINPILLEKNLGRFLEVPFLGSPEGPLGWG